MKPYSVCPFCFLRIKLHNKKDFESFSKIEVLQHYRARHPEVLRGDGTMMPYTPIRFE